MFRRGSSKDDVTSPDSNALSTLEGVDTAPKCGTEASRMGTILHISGGRVDPLRAPTVIATGRR